MFSDGEFPTRYISVKTVCMGNKKMTCVAVSHVYGQTDSTAYQTKETNKPRLQNASRVSYERKKRWVDCTTQSRSASVPSLSSAQRPEKRGKSAAGDKTCNTAGVTPDYP